MTSGSMKDYAEYHENRSDLLRSLEDPIVCPITGDENCQWAEVQIFRGEPLENAEFSCKIHSDKYADDQCPLMFNECQVCGGLVHEDDTVRFGTGRFCAGCVPFPTS